MQSVMADTFYNWKYVYGGSVKHALPPGTETRALCGVEQFNSDWWFGSGSQKEYEKLESLRKCRNCLAKIPDFDKE